MRYNDKNKKLCGKLGALQFQKLVFIVEKLKFKIIKKFFPNMVYMGFKKFDKKMKKMLANAKTEEEKNNIINYFRFEKMRFKRELTREEIIIIILILKI